MRIFSRQGRGDGAARAVFVPGEDVLLLSVALPPMPAAQRRAAVAFAVEDRVARPLDEVHVVLGPALPGPPGRWLVAVVGRGVLATYLARLRPGPGVRVLPDTVTVAVPPAGHWAARADGGRVILRMADGTGMVVAADMLEALHAVAGQPVILWQGAARDDTERPPTPVPSPPGGGEAQGGDDAAVADCGGEGPASRHLRLAAWRRRGRATGVPAGAVAVPEGPDLRTAAGDEDSARLTRNLSRVAAAAAVLGAVHLALLVAENAVLSQRLAARGVALRAALSEAGLPPGGDAEAALSRAMAERQRQPDGFLAVLAQAMAAMGPLSGQATLRDLQFGEAGMAMTVQAPDLATLQAVGMALSGASLRVVAGAAVTAGGLAEQRLTVTQ